MISDVPNVLYLVWDDARIASWNAFGGLIDTPSMKWLAGRGVRDTQWHTPALSSPTRRALLTRRVAAGGRRYTQWHTPALSSPTRCALLTGRDGPGRPVALTRPTALTGPVTLTGPVRLTRPGDPRRRERSVVIPADAATLAEI